MRKVILGLAVSLDGFIEGPNGEYDWCFTDQDYGMKHFFERIDCMFIGRKSYELLTSSQATQPSEKDPFANIKKYVFSNSIKKNNKAFELINGDIKSKVNELKNKKGKDIWLFGGANLTTSFINEGLVDEIWLSVHPLILGGGKPLFSGIERRIPLKLMETKTYSTGLVSLLYQCV